MNQPVAGWLRPVDDNHTYQCRNEQLAEKLNRVSDGASLETLDPVVKAMEYHEVQRHRNG